MSTGGYLWIHLLKLWAWILVSEHIIACNPWWNPWWNDVIDGWGYNFIWGLYSTILQPRIVDSSTPVACSRIFTWRVAHWIDGICGSSSLSKDYGTARSNKMKYNFIKLLACFIYIYIFDIHIHYRSDYQTWHTNCFDHRTYLCCRCLLSGLDGRPLTPRTRWTVARQDDGQDFSSLRSFLQK